MATIEEAVVARLLGTAAVVALVGTRVMPQGTGQLVDRSSVYVTYSRADGRPVQDHGGPSGLRQALVTLLAHAPTYGQAKAVQNAVIAAVDGFRGTVMVGAETVAVGSLLVVADPDWYEEEARQHIGVVDVQAFYTG